MKKASIKEGISVQKPKMPKSEIDNTPLINWDNSTKIYLIICLSLFTIGIIGKFHTSNIPVWYQIFGEQAKIKKNVIFGKPQTIRSDEWMMGTPLLMNQLLNDLPLENPSAGPKQSIRVLGMMPVNTLSDYFRPNLIFCHFLDLERSVSYLNLTKHFFFLIFFFLFLKLITENNFKVSLFCTLLLYTTSIIQWWSVYTEFLFLGCAVFINFTYILFSKKPTIIILNTISLFAFTYSYIVFLYPPYQIPCTFIILLTTIYFLINYWNKDLINVNILLKIGSFSMVTLLLGYFLFEYYNDTKSVYDLALNTVYPGKRDSTTDVAEYSKMFSEYLFFHLTPESIPQKWGNICEASGTIMFFPLIFFHIGYNFIYKLKNSSLLLALTILLIVYLIHFYIGFPSIINKISLLSFIPKYRITYGIGLLNIVMLAIYLSSKEYKFPIEKIWIPSIMLIVFIFSVNQYTGSRVDNFFSINQIVLSTIIFSILMLSLLYFNFKWVSVVSFLIIFIINGPNLLANPVSRGLKPLTSNPLYKQIKDIRDTDKEAKWITFGNFILSAYGKSTGAKFISGVNFVPDYERLKILDPSLKNDSVYNRYAHVTYLPFVNGTDSVAFNLIQSDSYQVYLDPSSNRINKMGVTYVLFTYVPQPIETRNLLLVSNTVLPIYKIKD